VREQRRRVSLVVAAKTSSALYRRQAEERVAAIGGGSVVLLFNSKSVPDLLASSDLFIYATPSDSNDSLPRALLEAQAAGLPAVTTDTVGCGEIVHDRRTGRVVPYDAGKMAEAILEIMDSAGSMQVMGEQAASHVRDTFSWARMGDRYAEVFVSAAAERLGKAAA
jgi:glycosyltransferase involved in cell wall biosynthesis